MRQILMGIAGAALAGGLAFAQQESTREEVDQYGEEIGQPADELEQVTQAEPEDPAEAPSETEDPLMGEESQAEETWGEESGMQHSVADLDAGKLKGMTVVTETGEELGKIDRVGQERVVTVDVGGFLGIAEKTITIPVTELEMTPEGHVQTTLTRESIQAHGELDEDGFTEEGAETELETETETPETDY